MRIYRRRGRRIVRRRRTQSRTRATAFRSRVVRVVRRMAETKLKVYQGYNQVGTVPSYNQWFSTIQQGNDVNQRSGDTIMPKRISLSGYLSFAPATTGTIIYEATVRILVLFPRKAIQLNLSSDPDLQGITTYSDIPHEKFIVLMDKRYHIGESTTCSLLSRREVNFSKAWTGKINYGPVGEAPYNIREPLLYYVTDAATSGATVGFRYHLRTSYKDF